MSESKFSVSPLGKESSVALKIEMTPTRDSRATGTKCKRALTFTHLTDPWSGLDVGGDSMDRDKSSPGGSWCVKQLKQQTTS